ncbi:protein NO VEIN domain-containing protein [Arthrobacter sp. Ld5]|uniref:protein NO VEIN domain-containing protein n=1 Tax=Arthrobacter sp. Ld5 TaxID=649152 RepID=UPI003EBA61EE
MIPAEGVIVAAARWVDLLGRSSEAQAAIFIRSNSEYADLTPTQYSTALQWLHSLSWTELSKNAGDRVGTLKNLTPQSMREKLLTSILESAEPPWLEDADVLVHGSDDLPQDIERWSELLRLPGSSALRVVRRIGGKIDLARRAEIGEAGEIALTVLLEAKWPGEIKRVAATDDGYGYDISALVNDVEWHLEVKSTTRRGRLSFFLSRHEFETGLSDKYWRLLVIGLDDGLRAICVAEVDNAALRKFAPGDRATSASWTSARFDLGRHHLSPGLLFLPWDAADSDAHRVLTSGVTNQNADFAWMPVGGGQTTELAIPSPE